MLPYHAAAVALDRCDVLPRLELHVALVLLFVPDVLLQLSRPVLFGLNVHGVHLVECGVDIELIPCPEIACGSPTEYDQNIPRSSFEELAAKRGKGGSRGNVDANACRQPQQMWE